MVDIRIVEVPHQWKGKVPSCEIGSEGNSSTIKLMHQPSGTLYSVEVNSDVSGMSEIARLRAEAKMAFFGTLSGDA